VPVRGHRLIHHRPSSHQPTFHRTAFDRTYRPRSSKAPYDPHLDVVPLVVPNVPETRLINNVEFEGWDVMLNLIRKRQADKAERNEPEWFGLVEKSRKKKSNSNIVGLCIAGRWLSCLRVAIVTRVMDIEYKKRGSVREKDLGKETPT
jgi:hypothetical protein